LRFLTFFGMTWFIYYLRGREQASPAPSLFFQQAHLSFRAQRGIWISENRLSCKFFLILYIYCLTSKLLSMKSKSIFRLSFNLSFKFSFILPGEKRSQRTTNKTRYPFFLRTRASQLVLLWYQWLQWPKEIEISGLFGGSLTPFFSWQNKRKLKRQINDNLNMDFDFIESSLEVNSKCIILKEILQDIYFPIFRFLAALEWQMCLLKEREGAGEACSLPLK